MDRYVHSHQPPARLGVDFGNGFLVIGIEGPEGPGFRTLEFPGWSKVLPGTGETGPVYGVPVQVCYDHDGTWTIGEEVMQSGHSDEPGTARWIRNYLLEESPIRIPAGPHRQVTFRDAATDLLTTVLARAQKECPGYPELIFSLPAGAPEWYAGWLGSIAGATGLVSWNTLDELTATVAGYGLPVNGGQMFIVIHFDETDFSVSIVRGQDASTPPSSGGMRVAGQAGDDTGCRAIDTWIAQDMLAGTGLKFTGARTERIRDTILKRMGEVYGQLADTGKAVLDITDTASGTTISAGIARADLDRIVAEHEFPATLDRMISRAWASARSHGYADETPAAVLMTGRGSSIPAVQDLVKVHFPGVPIRCDHPFDAVARGAVLFTSPADRPDRIRNDYALRYGDPSAREHRYRFLVRSGARYPSAGQVARITISAAYDGQTRLGIPLYEFSVSPDPGTPALELVLDPAGGVRLAGPAEEAGPGSMPVPVNGRTPTLLAADPPALKGEPRFELTFTLDRERYLCVTARDLATGTLVKKDAPVHRLE
jgi:hypothetical protein